MATQSQNGKAFEYVCLISAFNTLKKQNRYHKKVKIIKNNAWLTTKNDFLSLDPLTRLEMIKSGLAGIKLLMLFEPTLHINSNSETLIFSIQIDKAAAGNNPDVRDVVWSIPSQDREIGISCKHNSEAVKHSRLSKRIDFGQEWMGEACSDDYWDNVNPIFDMLNSQRGNLWDTFNNKEDAVYVPLLNAFASEVQRICNNNSQAPTRLIEYLLGSKDFYKIISKDSGKITHLEVYNLHKTLGQKIWGVNPKVKITAPGLPDQLLNIDFKKDISQPNNKSKTTVIAAFNNGWSLSFRIHNASSRIENSLKFDIKLQGVPINLQRFTQIWE